MEISSYRPAPSSTLLPLQRSGTAARAQAQGLATGSNTSPPRVSLTEYVSEGEHLQREPLDYVDAIRRARQQQATAPQEGQSREQPANSQSRQALSAYGSNGPDSGVELLPRIDSYV